MSGDKTEEPTPHKLREARKKGQVAKSQDVTGALLLLIGFLIVYFTGGTISGHLRKFLRICFFIATTRELDPGILLYLVQMGVNTLFVVIMPICAVAFVIAAFANYMQVGVMITMHPLKPDIKKLNPIEGLKGMFKLRKLVELIKSSAKLLIVTLIAYFVVKDRISLVILSIRMPLWDTIGVVWGIVFDLCIRVAGVFGLIAIFDYAYQKWQFKKDMMMSKKDIKDEYKNQEGDPHIKGKRKQLHQEMAMSEGAQQARKADAVVVNPDHIAVAIQYDEDTMNAPQVIAKGERLWAEKIKEIAKEEGIPILRNVPLAGALNKLEVGEDIPEDLYDAVAEILQFVYQLAAERGEVENP